MRYTQKKENIERKLIWFDSQNNKMLEFKGGELKFDYDYKNNKTKVSASTIKTNKTIIENNKIDIQEWVDNNAEEFSLEVINVDERNVVIQFPEKQINIVEESLYNNRFRYEIYA